MPKKPSFADLKKPANNWANIKIGYNEYVLPYKEAAQIMEAFTKAFYLEYESNGSYMAKPLTGSCAPRLEVVAETPYLAWRMSYLLGAHVEPDTMDELKVVKNEVPDD